MNNKKNLSLWFPVVLWCLVIFGFSSIPTLPSVGFIWWDFILKKTAHLIEYGILYFLMWRAIAEANLKVQISKLKITAQSAKLDNFAIWLAPLIFGIIYAISDEYHQSFVMGRTAKVRDVGFDLAGMLIVLYLLKKKTEY